MTIQLSQVVLLAGFGFFLLYIFLLRTQTLDRIFYIGIVLVGIVLVLMPDVTTRLANMLGIGRGTDLLIYLFMMAIMFYAVTLRSQVKRLQDQITQIAREYAIDHRLAGSSPLDGKSKEGTSTQE